MTFPVPIEAARLLAKANIDRDYKLSDDEVARIGELIEFAERFEPQALPGMTQGVVQAGELREIHLRDETLKADEFDLIRLNGRVYAPETVEVEDDEAGKLPGWFESACLASMRHGANLQISPSQCDEILAEFGVKGEGRKLSVSEMDPAFGADS